MLLSFLYLFFNYDLVNCELNRANFEDSFLDYSMTEFWWNGTPGIDQTDHVTARYSLLPTPPGHGQLVDEHGDVIDVHRDSPPPPPTVSSEELHKYTPFPNITRASFPFSIDTFPQTPPGPDPLPSPWHINYPGLTPPANFPSDYSYPTVFPTMHDPRSYSPSPTGPTPRRPSFTLPFVSRPELTYPTLFATSSMLPLEEEEGTYSYEGRKTTTPETRTSGVSWDPAAAYISMWKEKLASEVSEGTSPLDLMPKLRAVFNYDYTTEESPLALGRIPSSRTEINSQKDTADAVPAISDPRSGGKASWQSC